MYSDYKKRITMVDNSMANIRDAVGWREGENEVEIKMLTSNELNEKSMAALENIESVMGEIVKVCYSPFSLFIGILNLRMFNLHHS